MSAKSSLSQGENPGSARCASPLFEALLQDPLPHSVAGELLPLRRAASRQRHLLPPRPRLSPLPAPSPLVAAARGTAASVTAAQAATILVIAARAAAMLWGGPRVRRRRLWVRPRRSRVARRHLRPVI